MISEVDSGSAGIAYYLTKACKFNRINQKSWLAWVLESIQYDPVNYINEFLPWEYRAIIDAQKSAGDEKAKINQE
jgi:hypothetical protein